LVKDPESGWSWVTPANIAELGLFAGSSRVSYQQRSFGLRNRNDARVEYVLGEVYWKCEVGETTAVRDYVSGRDVLSRESSGSEVRWSLSTPMPWPVVAQAFGLPADGAGAVKFSRVDRSADGDGSSSSNTLWIVIAVIAVVLLACAVEYCDDDGGGSGGGVHFGGGVFSGGK
jgi:hypothetical protein